MLFIPLLRVLDSFGSENSESYSNTHTKTACYIKSAINPRLRFLGERGKVNVAKVSVRIYFVVLTLTLWLIGLD